MIYDTLDFISGTKTLVKLANLEWYGWTPESDISKVDFFNNERVSCKCTGPCRKCGFYYLDNQGKQLIRTSTPLCGEW
jgi:hypothetical protein